MKGSRFNRSQQGFTIIELVVVILLLGILTATALPRFIDVTDEAHLAVVDAVEGGLGTGVALYRAQWFADNQPATVREYNGLYSNNTGWPKNLGAAAMADSDDCKELFQNLLQQAGRPSVTSITASTAALSAVTTGQTVAGFDFHSYLGTTAGDCQFIYTRQYRSSNTGSVDVIVYDPETGSLSRDRF